MAKFQERIKAREKRRNGESIGDIAKLLDVSKGTVSRWCSDLKLTKKQENRLREKVRKAGHYGRQKGAEMNKRKKIERINLFRVLAKKNYSRINKRELNLIITALYWAEGSKTRPRFSFSNSDPDMIKLVAHWLEVIEGISKNDLVVRVHINQVHRDRIEKVLKFWSSLLELPVSHFKPTSFIKTSSKKIYSNHDSYYGVLVLRVRRSSDLVYKMLGQIDVLRKV